MIEFDRDHGPGDVAQTRGFKPVVPAPSAGALERDQGRVLLERPDQGRLDPIRMQGGVDRQHGAGQGRQRQPSRPVVGPIHRIEDETVVRRAATDFQAPALFGIDDERQLEFVKDTQSRVVGEQVEAFDIVALRIPGPGSRMADLRDRAPHLAVEHEQPLRPWRVHGPGRVLTARTNIGRPTVGAIHRRWFEGAPHRSLPRHQSLE